MLKRSLLAALTIALMGLPALAGGKRLVQPYYRTTCQGGQCRAIAPPTVMAYPVAAPVVTQGPARVYPSPSSPPPAVAPASYTVPVVYYSTWPVPRGR